MYFKYSSPGSAYSGGDAVAGLFEHRERERGERENRVNGWKERARGKRENRVKG